LKNAYIYPVYSCRLVNEFILYRVDFMKGIIFALSIVMLICIWGCALKAPSFGDKVLAEGESRIEIADLWEQGKNESQKGEKQVLKGRKLVEKGRSDLREGESFIASGNLAVQNNRQAYQALSQISQGTASAEEAFGRAAKLKKIANAWEDGEEKIKKGNGLIHRGNALIDEGESEIRKGQQLIERGRDKMQEAESRYHHNSE